MTKSHHFVTLFDANYLVQGLSLLESLERTTDDFILWVLCCDAEVFDFLGTLDSPNLRLLKLTHVQTPELVQARQDRDYVEFLWALTPFVFEFVFDLDENCDQLTYLDADLYFFRSPEDLLDLFRASDKAVLITKHKSGDGGNQAEVFGRFNVQFVAVKRSGAEKAIDWWKERCLETTSSVPIEGVYGDQKYLDKFPEILGPRLMVVDPVVSFMGPWNTEEFRRGESEVIAYHFHSLIVLKFGFVRPYKPSWNVPEEVFRQFYQQYFVSLLGSQRRVSLVGKSHNLRISPWNRDIKRRKSSIEVQSLSLVGSVIYRLRKGRAFFLEFRNVRPLKSRKSRKQACVAIPEVTRKTGINSPN